MGDLQDPKMEVPTIYKAYFSGLFFRGYPPKIWPYMVLTYLHFRILEFPLKQDMGVAINGGWMVLYNYIYI